MQENVTVDAFEGIWMITKFSIVVFPAATARFLMLYDTNSY